jgi:OFA family oxalate/formate antiporter-like MFS transporter
MKTNRWIIALAGFLLQVALGASYAWSVFRIPLMKKCGWSISQVTLAFTISIFMLGSAAFFGDLWLNRRGLRAVALTGGLLYGLGVFLATFSDHKLWWLVLSYSVIGGVGMGLSSIVPVAVLPQWFPDRRGLVSVLVIGGFGAGTLVTASVATRLIQQVGVFHTFAYLGIAYLLLAVTGGLFMGKPPAGWQPEGCHPPLMQTKRLAGGEYTLRQALSTWQWWVLWLLLFLNTFAGISVISEEAPLFQETALVSAAGAAAMLGIASAGAAFGRVFWASASNVLSREQTFLVMFLAQDLLFWRFPFTHSASALTVVAFLILMCYGVGLGIMPAFAAEYFGSRNIGSIYGLMLTARGFGSVLGPLLIAAMRQAGEGFRGGLHIIALIMAVSVLLPVLVSPPKSWGRDDKTEKSVTRSQKKAAA